ncbi:hypothetical protein GCM10018783_06750 [Streptomyces griseosporeus]|nr:hypothetical protein GCM10018783_06750 [Streptomyces griseosporeus]
MNFEEVAGPRAAAALRHVAARSAGPAVADGLRITLNFHPDRLASGGSPLLHALARDGVYHSQFVTGTSNGGLTAHPGGDRWRWESRIFGGAYDAAPPHERPVYGALDFRHQVVGAAPRFGSSHFRLAPAVLARSTFCYPDSAAEPADFGVAAGMHLIALAEADERDPLNDYIEAHVHGGVDLARDVEALVLDACYRGTPVEAAARLLPCPVEWHPGYRITVAGLYRHADYRGREFADLGARIARDGVIDPRVIGDAARTGRYVLQDLKMVWHTLARFGAPEGAGTAYSDRPGVPGPVSAPPGLPSGAPRTTPPELPAGAPRTIPGPPRAPGPASTPPGLPAGAPRTIPGPPGAPGPASARSGLPAGAPHTTPGPPGLPGTASDAPGALSSAPRTTPAPPGLPAATPDPPRAVSSPSGATPDPPRRAPSPSGTTDRDADGGHTPASSTPSA